MNHKFLTPLQTRKWLKPLTFTSSFGTAIGAPWEILRSETVTKDGRLVEVYTKSGDLGFYHNQLVLIPDYDLVIVVLTAGLESSSEFSELVMSKAVRGILPAIEEAGKEEAHVSFAGTYADTASNSTLKLVLDDGPGFAVDTWVVRGVDFLAHFFSFSTSPRSGPVPPIAARLYPTNLAAGKQTAWRAVFEVGSPEERAFDVDADLFWPQGSCVVWGQMDRQVYAYNALDEFVFTTTESPAGAVAEAVTMKGFQVSLKRA